jgi:hypothetical protein
MAIVKSEDSIENKNNLNRVLTHRLEESERRCNRVVEEHVHDCACLIWARLGYKARDRSIARSIHNDGLLLFLFQIHLP